MSLNHTVNIPKNQIKHIRTTQGSTDGKLILVTAMSPTNFGEGKTLTSIGLGQALNRLGKKAIVAIREPSLGPVFGMKGGAAAADIPSTSHGTDKPAI